MTKIGLIPLNSLCFEASERFFLLINPVCQNKIIL